MGRRVKAGHFDVRVAASPLPHMRVGIVVPKYGNIIVKRNLLKRRLRELVRIRLLSTESSKDVLIRALPGAYQLSFAELSREFDRLVGRIAELT